MRKLKAILFTDIVGFTSMMGRNEDTAVEVLDRSKEIIQPLVKKYKGTWHKDLGDGALISFESSWDALLCALDIQDKVKNEVGLMLRIGIHMADVTHKDGDIIGDGVNIASRVQEEAKPGGICISHTLYNSVKNKEGIAVKSIGPRELKNVDTLMELYHVHKEVSLDIFHEKLNEIEHLFDKEKYKAVIMESVDLMEKAIAIFVNYFHTTLISKKDRLSYLQFEKEHGKEFLVYLTKPDIRTTIKVFDELSKLFPSNSWLNPKFNEYLHAMEAVSQPVIHEGKTDISQEESARAMDAVEGLLKISKLYSRSVEIIGFPLKYYLIYRSIKSKFEQGVSPSDFRKVIADATKILPTLLDAFSNKLYNRISFENKENLIQEYVSIIDSKKENEIKYYASLFSKIDVIEQMEGGKDVLFSLDQIAEGTTGEPTRRSTRHLINILDFVIDYTINPNSWHFLKYADEVKVRYLQKFELTDKDLKYLASRAEENNVSQKLAEKIQSIVVHTIEKELVLYLTLKETGRKSTEEQSAHQPPLTGRRLVPLVVVGSVALLAVVLYFTAFVKEEFDLPKYEKLYYDGEFERAFLDSEKRIDFNNDRANYFHLQLSGILAMDYHEYKDLENEKMQYYRSLATENSESAKAHLYLSLAFLNFWDASEWSSDSSWIALKRAEELGAEGEIYDLIKWQVYDQLATNQLKLEIADQIFNKYPSNTRAQRVAGATFLFVQQDTSRAIRAFQNSIKAYPKYATPYGLLGEIYLKRKQYDSAAHYYTQALEIGSNNITAITNYGELLKEQGQHEEAKSFYYEKLEDPKNQSPVLYSAIIRVYMEQDSLEEGFQISESALEKFPDNQSIKWVRDQMNDRKRQILSNQKMLLEETVIPWKNDLEEALSVSNRTEKPVLVEFNWTNSWQSKKRDRWIYPDSTIQSILTKFIPVKIRIETNQTLVDEYDIENEGIVVLDQEGTVIMEIPPDEATQDVRKAKNHLERALESFNRANISKKIEGDAFITVSNFDEALLIAGTRRIPILVIVGSSQSTSTQKLLNESLRDPGFKADFQNLVHVQLEPEHAKKYNKEWAVSIYPTALFFSDEGELITKMYGFQPPQDLVDRLEKVRDLNEGATVHPEVNWIYDLEESKAIAVVTKRDILLQVGIEYHDMYSDEDLIEYLESNFVSVLLSRENDELRKIAPGGWAFGGQYYLSQSGDFVKHSWHSEVSELLEWLENDEHKELMLTLGPTAYKDYSQKILLADNLSMYGAVRSSLKIYQGLIQELPTYSKNYLDAANLYNFRLRESENAIDSYERAIDNGEKISQGIVFSLIRCYLDIGEVENLQNLLTNKIEVNKEDPEIAIELYRGLSYLYQVLGREQEAIGNASLAVSAKNDYKSNLQLGKVLFHYDGYQAAREQLLKAIKQEDKAAEAFYFLSILEDSAGNKVASSEYWEKALQNKEDIELYSWHTSLAFPNFYLYPGLIELIEFQLKSNIKIHTDQSWYKRDLALFYVFMGRNHAGALDLINHVIEEDPNPYWPSILPVKAWILLELNRLDEVGEVIQELRDRVTLDEIDDTFLALYVIARYESATGNNVEANEYYLKVRNFKTLWPLDAIERKLQQDVIEMLESLKTASSD